MTTKSFFQRMADSTEISVNQWIPDGEIKGIVQLSHGMVEHAMRYDRFGSILAENGYLFSAHDHRGHGKTAFKAENEHTGRFGYLADKHGFKLVTDDIREIIDNLRKEYPGKKVILFGHSFGSFVAQNYIENYGNDLSGCILCGTAGPQPALSAFGFILSSVMALFCGKKHVSPLLNKLSFGSYNKRIDNVRHEYDWLSRDMGNVEMYENDKWCGYVPTVSFFRDLSQGLCRIYRKKNVTRIPRNLPVLIIGGDADPVGNYGKSIENLVALYEKNGMKNVCIREYPGARHELLNETNRDEVTADILSWISLHID